jgi:N-acetylneuraminic acid mutarotase
MPRVGSEGVAGVIGSKLYVLTGTEADEGDAFSRRFYRYDPATNKWTTLPSCPRFHRLGAGAVSKGKFYVVGGIGSNVGLDMYDPATNKWKALAAPPVTWVEAAAVATGGKLYVMGPGKSVYAYDPATNSWKTLAPMLTGRSVLAAAPLVTPSGNRKILAVGGFNLADSTSASDNELYTP